ncbi:MAG TPA: hypothetical protein VJ738_09775 [Steroidobacteraceae bacterium]|nr:hypothetical protein [Steroidobacteraceae bacterium]
MNTAPPPPTAPAPLPVRASSATLVNIVAWPAVALLGAGYLILIARLTSFPFEDLPDHLARAKVLGDLLFHHGARWGSVFAFHFRPVPYLLYDLTLTSLVAAFGTAAGGALFNEIVLLSLPCALLFYMHVSRLAPQARPLVLLVSLYLATDWFFLVGFGAFRLALALLIVCIALADLLRQRWSSGRYGIYLAVLVAGYFEHLTVPAFLAATLIVSGSSRLLLGRGSAREEARLLLPVLGLLGLYFGVFAGPHHAASPESYALEWGTVATKLVGLQNEFLRYGGRAAHPMMALLAVCVLWPVRRQLLGRRLLEPQVLEQLALAVTFLGIYIVLPGTYSGAAYVDVRALPMVVLFVLFAVLRLGSERDALAATLDRERAIPGELFAGAPALAAAVVLAAVNLGYVGWHLEKDNTWVAGYRAMVAQLPRGSKVLPIYTYPKLTIMPLEHSSAFVLLDRGGLIPYLFAGNLGDPMSYFDFNRRPYAPLEQWYRLQEAWNRAPLFTFEDQGQTYRWRFKYDVHEGDWKPAVLAPVSWSQVACEYPYILISQPYEPSLLGVPTRPLIANSSAALLAVDRSACRPAANGSAGTVAPAPQVTY